MLTILIWVLTLSPMFGFGYVYFLYRRENAAMSPSARAWAHEEEEVWRQTYSP